MADKLKKKRRSEAPAEPESADETKERSDDEPEGEEASRESSSKEASSNEETSGEETADEEAPSEEAPSEEDQTPTWDEPAPAPEATTVRGWLEGGRISKEMSFLFGLLLPAILTLVNVYRVRVFTIDDSYISFRYARNFARGWGLVYNEGERIEGYTNFLWTVLLGWGIKLGVDPETGAKVMGAMSAIAAISLTWLIAGRLRPYATLPCIATWLLASSIVFTGYAVFGLETSFFVALILGGTYLFLREEDNLREGGEPQTGIPWSGIAFGLAGITRPEAPMFIGILMLYLGKGIFSKKNILRGLIFAAPVAAHMLFRHSYYGTWLPNTFGAKTGNLEGQMMAGGGYVHNYLNHAGGVVWLSLLGLAIGVIKKRRDLLALGTTGLAVLGYVVLVGGDWMPLFRFMAPFEPFCFLLVDVGARAIGDRRDRIGLFALAAFALSMTAYRAGMLREAQAQFLKKEKRFWDTAAGGTARWLEQHNVPGEIAIGDIGYVGYKTDYPVLDLLGLVDPVISKLPGGYTQKLGPGFADRFFDKKPRYALIISANVDCRQPSVPGSRVIFHDRRFAPAYSLSGKVLLEGGFAWCIYEKRQ